MKTIALKDYLRETNVVRPRLVIAGALVVLLLLLLFARIWFLQVYQYDRYATLSLDNRMRLLPVPPVRGQIYDRKGRVLAENKPVYSLEILPSRVNDMDALIGRLGQLIDLAPDEIAAFRKAVRRRPRFEAQILKLNLSDAEVARFSVNRYRFSGADIRANLQRYYPYGQEMVHVVGYVGRISEQDLETIDRARYAGSKYIGRLGVEARYEDRLLGIPGYEQVETNAHGRLVRTLERTSPIVGEDIHLSVDVDLQIAARRYLGDYKGSVVALEPSTGAVLAFVSNPVYDPNLFVNGISRKDYGALRSDAGRPLLNRALNGRYAPGSTIKGVFGLAGLTAGRDPLDTVYCPGWFSLKGSRHRYRCWKHAGHGTMSLHDAIVQSCDVYFYQLANILGIERMHDFLTRFGFGRPTGIDLDGEPGGLVPSPAWKRRTRDEVWYPGETVITGIGQGFLLVTPLQLAAAAATLANRGAQVRPRLIDGAGVEGESASPGRDPDLGNEQQFADVIAAMEAVVHGERGTARRSGLDAAYRFAGKTGTAQVIGVAQGERYDADEIEERFRDHALFISFAPLDKPRIAVAVIAENGGGGSATAAPIARKVMDYYLIGPEAVQTAAAGG